MTGTSNVAEMCPYCDDGTLSVIEDMSSEGDEIHECSNGGECPATFVRVIG